MTSTAPSSNLHASLLALALLAALCTTAAVDANAAEDAGTFAVTVAHATRIRNGDAVTGALPASQPIHLELALKMRNRQGLEASIEKAAKDQQHGVAPQLMAPAQFLANHAPSPQQARAVVDYLTGMGFRNVTIAPNRMLVSADGTAANARTAFMTTLARVRTQDGRIAYANTDDARIPASLSDEVLAVVGLQTVHQARTSAHVMAGGGVHATGVFVHDPNEWQSIYGGNASANPANVVIGILTEGNLARTNTDLQNWFLLEGYDGSLATQTVNSAPASLDDSQTVQWDLDSENIVGMAGGKVRKLIFYNMPNFTHASLTANINKAVTANATKIIEVSLGSCETDAQSDGSAAAQDAILAVAVAQGQTFAVATGDLGADECPSDGLSTPVPSWPAASQYVVAVAGTRLTTNATADAWIGETAWTKTGGSSSTFEPKPSWQSTFSETIGATTYTVPGTTRAVADVAFDADPKSGAVIFYGGSLSQVGGSAIGTSIFVGTWARVLQLHPGIGFAGPVIYALPRADFHDVASGSNGMSAGTSYDVVSGRGSMIVDSVVADSGALGNKPPTANYSFTTTGLTANFTDTSTDTDGTIATHFWTFGDGATSTAANPSHTYAAAGTYSVRETVKDNAGASAARLKSVVVH